MALYDDNHERTVTITLNDLGNADLWNIWQIVTGHTGNTWAADEEDALPCADIDAATEVFLHIAETANARSKDADPAQRIFLQGIRDDYLEVFEEDHDVYTLPADEDKAREIEQAATRLGLGVEIVCKTNAGGYVTTAEILGDTNEIEALLAEIGEAQQTDPEANEAPEDTRTGAELYADLLVQAFLDAPENSILDKTVGAAAREARDFPNDLYRAGYFDGMAELVAKMICLRNDFQDIPTLKAAIYKAYQVAR